MDEEAEQRDWLSRAMAALPEALRDTLALTLEDGMTQGQAAEIGESGDDEPEERRVGLLLGGEQRAARGQAISSDPVVVANRLYVQSDAGTVTAFAIEDPRPRRVPDVADDGAEDEA